ncbi:zygote arrest protein 1-like [Patiria miniata]|uniref:3CxxC-type domain-containing protein n=1 Tax=Patiria miniata TaxID=46514 RepID=A0A913ZV54_PATMI|nr:zygote arrest protein 1-like [Patiria miniata]
MRMHLVLFDHPFLLLLVCLLNGHHHFEVARKRLRLLRTLREKSRMSTQRRYGYYRCPTCNRGWESAQTWCYKSTDEPSSGQQCQNADCPRDYIKPYKVEKLRCPKCQSNTGCICHLVDDDSDEYGYGYDYDERHNDPAKAHRSDLCERCSKGQACKFR